MRSVSLILLVLSLSGVAHALDKKLILETPEILAPFAPLVMDHFTRSGIDAEVRFSPFVRLSQDLTAGTIDGAFFLSEGFLRSTTLYEAVPVPLYRNEYMAVTLEGGPVVRSAQDLKGRTVAYPRGYSGMATVAEGAELTTVIDEEQGLRILGAGRVQVLIISRTSSQMFGALAGKPLVIHEPPLVTSLLYLVLHRSLTKEKAALTAAFSEAIRDGSWGRGVAEVIRRQTLR